MKNLRFSDGDQNILNTNEIMNDYSFFFQMIYENKTMDFEARESEVLIFEHPN